MVTHCGTIATTDLDIHIMEAASTTTPEFITEQGMCIMAQGILGALADRPRVSADRALHAGRDTYHLRRFKLGQAGLQLSQEAREVAVVPRV